MMMVVVVVAAVVPFLVFVLVLLCVFAKTTCLSHYIISHSFSFKFSTLLVHLSCGDGGGDVGGDGNHLHCQVCCLEFRN